MSMYVDARFQGIDFKMWWVLFLMSGVRNYFVSFHDWDFLNWKLYLKPARFPPPSGRQGRPARCQTLLVAPQPLSSVASGLHLYSQYQGSLLQFPNQLHLRRILLALKRILNSSQRIRKSSQRNIKSSHRRVIEIVIEWLTSQSSKQVLLPTKQDTVPPS